MSKLSCCQVGALIKKCVCRKKECDCGSHGPIAINPEAHKQFVQNMFAALKEK